MEQRNKQIANLLKLGVFLFGISLLLWNCEKDEIIPNTHTDNTTKPYTLATLNYKELTHDAEFSKSLKKIEKNLSTKNVSSKGSTGKKRLSILTNQIAKIKTKTTISWTFKLENTLKEASVFENLLVRKYNNEFSYFLVSYQGENNTNNGKNTEKSLLYSLSKEDFDFSELDIQARSDSFDTPGEDDGDYGGGGGSTPCNGVWIPEYKSCDAGGNADGHSPQKQWDGSYCSRSQLTGYVIDFSHCTNYTPPGGPSNDIPTDDTSSGGGGSGTGSSTGGDPIITTPVEDADGNTYTEAQIRTNNINRTLDNSLSLSELNFLSDSNNLATTKEVEAFLFKNTTSEAKTFAKQAIKALTNGGEVDFDDRIINNTNNPCVSAIIKALQEKDMKGALVPDLEGMGHLSQMILDLFDHSRKYNLTFKIGQLNNIGSGVNGNTSGFDITLDTDLVKDATKLFIAKTVIHESFHAYIHYVVRENPGSTMTTILKAYQNFYTKSNPTNAGNLTEHKFISQYVEALAYSLSSYDNHQQPMDYYKALSWAGLESSSAYQSLSNTDKTKIQNIIQNERFNKSGAKSTKC